MLVLVSWSADPYKWITKMQLCCFFSLYLKSPFVPMCQRHSRENAKGRVQEAQELICLCRGLEQWKFLKALDINLIDCSWGKSGVHHRTSQKLELLWLLYDCFIKLNPHKTTTAGNLRGRSLFCLSDSDYINLGRV